ncbi:MAG: O-antigen ligase family protein [Firmicutes bacterium]|nr:O-antigen ligase family protein [Bacillota bacterium]
MQHATKRQHSPSPAWLGMLWPFVIMAVGTALAFVSGPIGALVIIVGYVWLVVQSLPLALAVYVIAAPFPFGLTFHHHHINLSDAMAIIMAVRLLVMSTDDGLRSVWRRFLASPFWRPVVLLLVLSILSLATALSHSTTIVKILEYIEFFVVVVAVAHEAGLHEEDWKPILGALFGIASLLSLYGLYQFLFSVGPAANAIDIHHVRAEAVFGQPNAFGGFEAMVFPLIAALMAYGPRWARGWWMWVAAALSALGVIDSFSRGAWVAAVASVLAMGIAAWAIQGRTRINRQFVIPAIAVPILGFIFVDLLGKTNLTVHVHTLAAAKHAVKPGTKAVAHHVAKTTTHVVKGTKTVAKHVAKPIAKTLAQRRKIAHIKRIHYLVAHHRTTTERLVSTVTALVHPKGHFDTMQRILIWKEALKAIKQHPILGVGLGGFHRYAQLHPEKGLVGAPPMAHNLYLEWGADLGVLGIVAGLWLEWSWVRHAIQSLTHRVRQLTPFEFALGLGAFGTMVSFIVHDWVDFMIDHGVIVPLLLAMAAVWSLHDRREAGGKR